MNSTSYVLKYNDGRFVARDDSTGPFSSGGYPYPVDTLDEATLWQTAEDAAAYGNIGGFRDMERKVYPLKVTYALDEPIDFPQEWSSCNHHCISTSASTAPTAAHFLDCPVWAHNKR